MGDWFPLPVNTGRVDGRAFPLAELTVDGPSTRPVLTGNGNRSPVNSGSGNRALQCFDVTLLYLKVKLNFLELLYTADTHRHTYTAVLPGEPGLASSP